MPNDDLFKVSLALGDWLYTLAIGIGIGLLVAAGRLVIGYRANKLAAAFVGTSGILLLAICAALVYDAGPFDRIGFRLKPYLSDLADAALLLGAMMLGVLTSLMLILGARRVAKHNVSVIPVVAVCALGVGFLLWRVDSYVERNTGRHPLGTDTSATLKATPVIPGLDVPTGINIAKNGDIAVVELSTANFRLFSPEGEGFRQVISLRLPIPENRLAFHVVFHPDYPAEPYVFVSAEAGPLENRTLQVLRARIDGANTRFTPVIEGLPAAKVEESGDHFGSALTFCQGYFFVTTGDTEGEGLFRRPYDYPGVIREEAQDLSSARGKVLRWKLDGIELVPAGITGQSVPVFAFGFRNSFGIDCDPDTGNPVVAENGNRGRDQVRAVPPGSNHEWPLSEVRDHLAAPLFDSGEVHLAPTGVAYRSAASGAHELVVSAFQSQALYLLPIDSSGRPARLRLLLEVEGGAFGVTADSHGCIYFSGPDAIWRLDDGRCEP